jgi:hypothetical protein
MGATSVTGVGPGSSEGYNRGTSRMTLGSSHLIGPHVVLAGNVALVTGAKTVNLSSFDASVDAVFDASGAGSATTSLNASYSVIACDNSGTAAAVSATLAYVSSKQINLVLAGTGTNKLSYMVVKNGLPM